ncbi:acyl transferase domain-containing protein [Nostoc commune NIES-4072]|uniref:Acyl transferase domain-containing protein n=1 Tax=Nostoc commune NIES-4072 TaxID=2005467 RepID=A0A2R5G694_NOSCO|nr:hypothetical protein [Nostoc commune]BBD70869.1 acyl transferase domain-containing protein [Nostoc commune HK-02]GBG23571.1 acyl transferase domain-containing protein [Nostoc commune NIES-4072]
MENHEYKAANRNGTKKKLKGLPGVGVGGVGGVGGSVLLPSDRCRTHSLFLLILPTLPTLPTPPTLKSLTNNGFAVILVPFAANSNTCLH